MIETARQPRCFPASGYRGEVAVRAIRHCDLYALTHPEWYPMVERRHQAIAAAFREAEAGPR